MKKSSLLAVILTVLLVGVVMATTTITDNYALLTGNITADWGFFNHLNTTGNVSVTGNVTADWFFGRLNWSDIKNAPLTFSFNNTNIAYTNNSNNFTQDQIISSGENLYYDALIVQPKLIVAKTSASVGNCVFDVNVTNGDGITVTNNDIYNLNCWCSLTAYGLARSACQISDAGSGNLVGQKGSLGHQDYVTDSTGTADIRIVEAVAVDSTRYFHCEVNGKVYYDSCVILAEPP